ncbi:MAG: hypothetical protein M1839_008723 [Geoglossum umbratile]|nr:MAG: hypothetical protein M1839_008723 [Geoglossum umbratile]
MPTQKALSQEEIWDDSSLLQSWDEALNEYKLYHSIHVRGETIDEYLESAEAPGMDNVATEHGQVSTPEPASEGALELNLPQNLVGEVQDDALKNLMMSWYWAGYYTGLNEGLNQAKQKTGAQTEEEKTAP